jgi:hypothetical protein
MDRYIDYSCDILELEIPLLIRFHTAIIAKDPLKRPNNMSILDGLQNSGNSKVLGHLNMKKRHFKGI